MAAGWTQADIDSLKAAIATGVLTVSYAGPPSRTVQYHSPDAMMRTLATMVREVSGTPNYRRVRHNKGFRD